MPWGEQHKPSWEVIARRMMVATRRYVDCPNTGNFETLNTTLQDLERLTKEE